MPSRLPTPWRMLGVAAIRVGVALAVTVSVYMVLAYVGAGPRGALDVRFKLADRGLGIDRVTEALFLSIVFLPLVRSWWLARWRERESDAA